MFPSWLLFFKKYGWTLGNKLLMFKQGYYKYDLYFIRGDQKLYLNYNFSTIL